MKIILQEQEIVGVIHPNGRYRTGALMALYTNIQNTDRAYIMGSTTDWRDRVLESRGLFIMPFPIRVMGHNGVLSTFTGNGTGVHYRIYNALGGSGTGEQQGVYNNLSNNATGVQTGYITIFW